MGRKILALVFLGGLWAAPVGAQEAEREPITMEIIATNPSLEKPQDVTIREAVPAGLSRKEDIEVPRELEVEFDSKTSLFYIVARKREKIVDGKPVMVRTIELEPGEADRKYTVKLKDVWYIEPDEMDGLKKEAADAMEFLERSVTYGDRARRLVDRIGRDFREITAFQTNDGIDKKEYIDSYLNRKEKLREARASIEEMARYIKLEREKTSEVAKTDEDMPLPSKTATWLVIFIILVFLGILTGAFYFVWQRRAHLLEGPLSEGQQEAFPESRPGEEEEGT